MGELLDLGILCLADGAVDAGFSHLVLLPILSAVLSSLVFLGGRAEGGLGSPPASSRLSAKGTVQRGKLASSCIITGDEK